MENILIVIPEWFMIAMIVYLAIKEVIKVINVALSWRKAYLIKKFNKEQEREHQLRHKQSSDTGIRYVIAEDDIDLSSGITSGFKYRVINEGRSYLAVINDHGVKTNYERESFKEM